MVSSGSTDGALASHPKAPTSSLDSVDSHTLDAVAGRRHTDDESAGHGNNPVDGAEDDEGVGRVAAVQSNQSVLTEGSNDRTSTETADSKTGGETTPVD